MQGKEKFCKIIKTLIMPLNGVSVTGIDILGQFQNLGPAGAAPAKKLNAAFLIKLSGKDNPMYKEAFDFINSLSNNREFAGIAAFFKRSEELIFNEIKYCYAKDKDLQHDLDNIYTWLENNHDADGSVISRKIRNFFFPEAGFDITEMNMEIAKLREKRKVTVTCLNEGHIKKPESEILFTSNALLTIPSDTSDMDKLDIDPEVKAGLKKTVEEDQLYWYDHPVQIGTSPENNEIIYGLEKLDEALAFEEKNGVKEKNVNVNCVLSVSVTHRGLQDLSKVYIESELKKNSKVERLNIYVFTEKDCKAIIDEILNPIADKLLGVSESGLLYEIFGVDGEYGRHYSFLKAISAFWNVFINPEVKGTFKIDLDQVFPQELLKDITGSTAFEHLKSALWGADGLDSNNEDVHLGLIAGALVNERDIGNSIYTPDVKFPDEESGGDSLVFYSTLPQALSTEAEMQTRYTDGTEIDGENNCIQRIHVTGGTNGILIESLRKYRPFTPSFIGRAEDQSYILSALFNNPGSGLLRYVHRDGLIMRHDKEAFASEAIEAARLGKVIGDYIRIILFSFYAEALPWDEKKIKNAIGPFTGCFVSRLPWTVVCLRLALKTADLFSSSKSEKEGCEIMEMGAERLFPLMETMSHENNSFTERFAEEKKGWDLYYDILNAVEKKLKRGGGFVKGLQKKAQEIVQECRLNI